MKALAQALLEFQKDAPSLHRDAENPHFKSRFLSLEGLMAKLRPALNAHGLVVTQWPVLDEAGGPGLRTVIVHAESGEQMESTMPLMLAKSDPQGQGSAITYARRYALMSALALVADEDDDGNAATTNGDGVRLDLTDVVKNATKAGQLPIHFGKNRGVLLGSLTRQQLQWYADKWTVQDDPSEYDHLLKSAAAALLTDPEAGLPEWDPNADVPF